MAQLHLTLKEDFLQALLLPNDGEPMRKLMEKIVNTPFPVMQMNKSVQARMNGGQRELPTAMAIAEECLQHGLKQSHYEFENSMREYCPNGFLQAQSLPAISAASRHSCCA